MRDILQLDISLTWFSDERPPTARATFLAEDATDWTHIHSFYAIMNGFALEPDPGEEQFLPSKVTRIVLTSKGLKFLATYAPEMIPKLPALSKIMDRSKTSSFAKAVICLQVV